METQYSPGDTVLVNDFKCISALLNAFCPNLDCIKPLSIDQIASKYAQIVDVVNAPGGNPDFDDFAVLLLETGQDFVLPLQGFQHIKIEIEDSADDKIIDLYEQQLRRNSTISQENVLVYHMAAEIIQTAYRRYRECKRDIKTRRALSSEQFVLNLAAETISRNLKKIIQKAKAKGSLNEYNQYNEKSLPKLQEVKEKLNGLYADKVSLTLGDFRVDDVPNMAWNETNSLYVLIESFDWHYKTDTKYSTGKKAEWKGDVSTIQLVEESNEQHIKFYIYHECLAIQDKLVGVCDIPLSLLQNQNNNSNVYTSSLYDSMNIIKRKSRGSFSFQFHFSHNPPTLSNWISSQIMKEEKSNRLSCLEGSTVSTKYIDCNDSHIPSINGISASKVIAAVNTLNHYESIEDSVPISSRSILSSMMESTKSEQSANKLAINLSNILEKQQQQQQQQTAIIINNQKRNNNHKEDLLLFPEVESQEISPYATSRISNITDEIHQQPSLPSRTTRTRPISSRGDNNDNDGTNLMEPQQQRVFKKTRTMSTISSSSTTHRGNKNNATITTTTTQKLKTIVDNNQESTSLHGKPLQNTSIIYQSSYHLQHHIIYVFDELFYMILTKYCASITITIQEFIILLDSIDIVIHPKYIQYALYPTNHLHENSNIMNRLSIQVIIAINHPNAFAASVQTILSQHTYLLDDNDDENSDFDGDNDGNKIDVNTTKTLLITPFQATSAIHTMVKLMKGDYDNIRGMIFLACRNNNHNHNMDRMDNEPEYDSTYPKLSKRLNNTLASSNIMGGNNSKNVKNISKSNTIRTDNNLHMTMNMIRPKHFSISSIQKIILMMNIHQLNVCFSSSLSSSPPGAADSHLSPTSSMSITSTTVVSTGRIEKTAQMNGVEFLNVSKESLINIFHIQSSLLRTRFLLYQETLQLIESFWDNGIRPNDPVEGDKGGLNDVSSLERMKKKYYVASSSHTNNNMPSDDIENHNHVAQDYQLADANTIFHNYMSLNRAYGWGFSLSHLTTLCNHIGSFYSWSKALPPSSTKKEYGELLWVKIEFPSKEVKLSALRAIETTFSELNHTLVRLAPMDNSSDPNLLDVNNDVTELIVNVPKSCCKKVNNRNSWLSQQSIDIISSEELRVGDILRVIPSHERLCRLCEQYEWWDRPTLDVLQYFTDQFVEVISINETMTKRRVGVKLIPSKKQRKEYKTSLQFDIANICDALPVQAFIRYNPSDAKQYEEFQKITSVNIPSTASGSMISSVQQSSKKSKLRNIVKSADFVIEETEDNINDRDEEPQCADECSETWQRKGKKKKKQRKKKKIASENLKGKDVLEEKEITVKKCIEPFIEDKKRTEFSSLNDLSTQKDESILTEVTNVKTSLKSKDQIMIEKKDYSWLKAKKESSVKPQQDNLIVSESGDVKHNDVSQPLKQLKPHQAELDLSHAVFAAGILPQPRPTSATPNGHSKRKTIKTNPHDEEGKRAHENCTLDDMEFAMKGFGYTEEGKVKTAAFSPTTNEFPMSQKTKSNRPSSRTKTVHQNLFEFHEREKIAELPLDLPFTAISMNLAPSPGRKKNTVELGNKIQESTKRDEEQDMELQSMDENETPDRNIAFDVEITRKAASAMQNHKKSLKEALLFEKEMTRTAKEFQKKENHILRELKRLGIDMNNTQNEKGGDGGGGV